MRRLTAQGTPRDRGAAAVEFALLLPMLLLLLFGIIDFGRALNAQITLTQAAREGARIASVAPNGVPNTLATVTNGTVAAATPLSGVTLTPAPTICPLNALGTGADAKVTVSYKFTFLTPVAAISSLFGSSFGSSMTLTATGVMPCET